MLKIIIEIIGDIVRVGEKILKCKLTRIKELLTGFLLKIVLSVRHPLSLTLHFSSIQLHVSEQVYLQSV